MADISDRLAGSGLLEEIISASNRHYNRGLFLAKQGDLSGAQAELKKSLKFYKYNTDTRNLLGLIFYRQGEWAAAVLQWAVSAGLEKRENIANTYIEAIQKYPDGIKTLNSPLRQYNTALVKLQGGHTDIAVLELKKAVEQSPCFIRAKQLLALIYIQQGRMKEAYRLLKSTLEIDRHNECSLKYLKEIEGCHRTDFKKRRRGQKDLPFLYRKKETSYEKDGSRRRSYVYIAGGFLIGAAAAVFLTVPSAAGYLRAEFNAQVIEYSELLSKKNEEVYTLKKELEANEEETAKAALTAANAEISDSDEEQFFKAIKAYMMNERENAGQLIASVDPEKLKDGAMTDIYSLICSETKELVTKDIYKAADEAFRSGNYTEALSQYEKADRLDKKPENKLMMAKCYEKMADIIKAKACYRELIEEYPGTKEADTAGQAIEEIESEITQR